MKTFTKATAITSANPITQCAIDICRGAQTMVSHAVSVAKAYKAAEGDAAEQKIIRHAWRVGCFMVHQKCLFTETRAIVSAEKSKGDRTPSEQLAYEHGNRQWTTFVVCTNGRAKGNKQLPNEVVIPRALKAGVAALLASYDFAVVMAALKAAK